MTEEEIKVAQVNIALDGDKIDGCPLNVKYVRESSQTWVSNSATIKDHSNHSSNRIFSNKRDKKYFIPCINHYNIYRFQSEFKEVEEVEEVEKL